MLPSIYCQVERDGFISDQITSCCFDQARLFTKPREKSETPAENDLQYMTR